MDPYYLEKLDPDPHQRKMVELDPDLDQHCDTAHPETLEARNGAMEANNGAIDDSEAQKWIYTSK